MDSSNVNDIFQAQPRFVPQPASSSRNKRVGKPPTRLQNRAPKALDLDQVVVRNTTPIPLLSPLVLSPAASVPAHDHEQEQPPAAAVHDQFMFPAVSSGTNEVVRLSQHESMMDTSGYNTEPSSLFMFFQSQCVLVDQAQ